MIGARFPSLGTALKFHSRLIDRYGGSHGLRDQGTLESALAATQIYMKDPTWRRAPQLMCITFHRPMLSSMETNGSPGLFLEINGVILTVPEIEAEELCMRIAARQITRDEVEQCFTQWIMTAN